MRKRSLYNTNVNTNINAHWNEWYCLNTLHTLLHIAHINFALTI